LKENNIVLSAVLIATLVVTGFYWLR